jgi:hypothetical protein
MKTVNKNESHMVFRKRVLIFATASVALAGLVLIALLVSWLLYGDGFELAVRESRCETCVLLARIVRAMWFRVVPGLCILTLLSGFTFIWYLYLERVPKARRE